MDNISQRRFDKVIEKTTAGFWKTVAAEFTEATFDKVIEKTTAGFWKTVADEFTEATSGVVSADVIVDLQDQMREAVAAWVETNVPNTVKVTEVLLHDIEYRYKAGDREMTAGDREHVAYYISQGYREGELYGDDGSDETHYGWWSIKK